MRGLFLRLSAVCVLVIGIISLVSCTRVISSPSDELKMYRWTCEEENGCSVSLSFDETDAELSVVNDSFTFDIKGLCVLDEDTLTICDSDSGNNYSFGYQLYGDRVELSFNAGVLELNKAN